jgi:Protein of unknown function (DUF3891)
VIVLRRDGRLRLLRQLDHAALAGELAARWGDSVVAIPAERESAVLAASRHDEGWRESDDRVRYDPSQRAPLSFLDAEIGDYVELYARGIARIAELDPYAGLLVSMHGSGNVCGRWGNQRGIRLSRLDAPTWRPVIERFALAEEERQARLKLGLLGLDPVEPRSRFEARLWTTYDLLQVWDRLSLFLCRTEPGEAAEAELGSVGDVALRVVASPGNGATVEPWPFAEDALELEVAFEEIPDREYVSQADLDAELGFVRRGSLRWSLVPARSMAKVR